MIIFAFLDLQIFSVILKFRAKKATKSPTLSKTILKTKSTDDGITTAIPYTLKYDNLISFQFKIFNPLKCAMQYLQRLQEDRDGKITLHIPFMCYLTFLIFLVGGSGAVGALVGGPNAYVQGQLAERNIWITMPTPTPIVVIPTPAPVLATRLGTIKATYQVKICCPHPHQKECQMFLQFLTARSHPQTRRFGMYS